MAEKKYYRSYMMTEYETRLLGQIMKYPKLADQVNLPAKYFSITGAKIYEKILELHSEKIEIDILLLASKLPEINPGIIANLSETISNANFEYYQNEIREAGYKTRLLELSEKIPTMFNAYCIENILQEIQDTIDGLADTSQVYKITKIGDVLPEVIDELEARYKTKDNPLGFKTGIPGLDEILVGDTKQRLFCIGARPSEGKSALMLNFVKEQAINRKEKVGIINLESGMKEMVYRMFADVGNIGSQRIANGFFNESDRSRITDCADQLRDKNIYFYDEPNISLTRLISKMRELVYTAKVKIIYIDYLQLLHYPKANLKRNEEIAYISRMLKEQARRLNIPIVILSQLTRDAENRRPKLADFSESSQIEKDVDVAILIYHRKKEKHNKYTGDFEVAIDEWWLCVDKNRDGAKKAIPVDFQAEYMRFVSRYQE